MLSVISINVYYSTQSSDLNKIEDQFGIENALFAKLERGGGADARPSTRRSACAAGCSVFPLAVLSVLVMRHGSS